MIGNNLKYSIAGPTPDSPYSLGKLVDWKRFPDGFIPLLCRLHPLIAPYSLGKLVDWKLYPYFSTMKPEEAPTPYSLGKLVDWKRLGLSPQTQRILCPPYSLGKLVDWKLYQKLCSAEAHFLESPYSLGKLVDWKRPIISPPLNKYKPVPSPYSLGKLVDWKRGPMIGLNERAALTSPYSLGKLVDWKPSGL